MEIKPIELADGLEFAAEVQGGTIITIRKDGRPQSSDVHHAITDGTIVFSGLTNAGQGIQYRARSTGGLSRVARGQLSELRRHRRCESGRDGDTWSRDGHTDRVPTVQPPRRNTRIGTSSVTQWSANAAGSSSFHPTQSSGSFALSGADRTADSCERLDPPGSLSPPSVASSTWVCAMTSSSVAPAATNRRPLAEECPRTRPEGSLMIFLSIQMGTGHRCEAIRPAASPSWWTYGPVDGPRDRSE